LRERFTRDRCISVFIGLAGLALVFSPHTTGVGLWALTAAAISELATAGNMIIVKQLPFSAVQSALLLWTASVIANTVMALGFREALPSGLHHAE
jgi:drug/metabolite transporter (DMT)-like permease